MLKRLGNWLRRLRQPSAPDAGVQLEEYDSHLPGTDRPARTPPAPNQGCHRREAPARGPRCTVSRLGPGSRQLGDPACSQDSRAFPTRTPAVRAGSVGRPAGRKGFALKPGRLNSAWPRAHCVRAAPTPSGSCTSGHLLSWTRTEYRSLPRYVPSCPQSDAASCGPWTHQSDLVSTPRAPTRTGPATRTSRYLSDARTCSRHGPQ